MLRIIVPAADFFNESDGKFVDFKEVIVDLEHSLISVSKWESEFGKPFLARGERTTQEIYGYIRAMIVTSGVTPDVLQRLSAQNIEDIQRYIDSPQSATTFGSMPERRGPGETITSELIYYWMVAFNIPFECQYWHLNRLFALVRICNIKNSKQPKMSRNELAQRNRDLNAQRRAQLGTSG